MHNQTLFEPAVKRNKNKSFAINENNCKIDVYLSLFFVINLRILILQPFAMNEWRQQQMQNRNLFEPVSKLPLPQHWCSVTYYELDVQVNFLRMIFTFI
jgi:hypothetical protein